MPTISISLMEITGLITEKRIRKKGIILIQYSGLTPLLVICRNIDANFL